MSAKKVKRYKNETWTKLQTGKIYIYIILCWQEMFQDIKIYWDFEHQFKTYMFMCICKRDSLGITSVLTQL